MPQNMTPADNELLCYKMREILIDSGLMSFFALCMRATSNVGLSLLASFQSKLLFCAAVAFRLQPQAEDSEVGKLLIGSFLRTTTKKRKNFMQRDLKLRPTLAPFSVSAVSLVGMTDVNERLKNDRL